MAKHPPKIIANDVNILLMVKVYLVSSTIIVKTWTLYYLPDIEYATFFGELKKNAIYKPGSVHQVALDAPSFN